MKPPQDVHYRIVHLLGGAVEGAPAARNEERVAGKHHACGNLLRLVFRRLRTRGLPILKGTMVAEGAPRVPWRVQGLYSDPAHREAVAVVQWVRARLHPVQPTAVDFYVRDLPPHLAVAAGVVGVAVRREHGHDPHALAARLRDHEVRLRGVDGGRQLGLVVYQKVCVVVREARHHDDAHGSGCKCAGVWHHAVGVPWRRIASPLGVRAYPTEARSQD
mmetsp:Transcript_16079/g.43089  ORF Transcript_16079/g.43089 Transcript_16079/m.43089 type:complete len:218 (-) Transcript_16079:83-736(-)